MNIFKRIAALASFLVGVFFIIIAVRVALWPPKQDSGLDLILGALLMSAIPFILATWLFKTSLGKNEDTTHNG